MYLVIWGGQREFDIKLNSDMFNESFFYLLIYDER
jgi:hypothetical protein